MPRILVKQMIYPFGMALKGIEAMGNTATVITRSQDTGTPKSFLSLVNISVAFLGIQFAWAIQMGQMSILLERLGASAAVVSMLWCAGPVTGIVVQPLVGSWSDKTWTALGRRRPFLLTGAILAAICLIIMPNSPALWVAAVLAWILDASLNISQGPYRALVPDVVSQKQQAFTFTLMGCAIGLGSVCASLVGTHVKNMNLLFYAGAAAIVLACLWTIATTPESKREDGHPLPIQGTRRGFGKFVADTWHDIITMPREVKKLCLVHSMTWFGWQCLYIFFALYLLHHIYFAYGPKDAGYTAANQMVFLCYGLKDGVCLVVSPFIGRLCMMMSEKRVHTVGLLCFAVGMMGLVFAHQLSMLPVWMVLIGLGWATTLSVPFALLSHHVPPGEEGVLMGTFNIFIAAPQFIASILTGILAAIWFHGVQIEPVALSLGAGAVLLSAFCLQWIHE